MPLPVLLTSAIPAPCDEPERLEIRVGQRALSGDSGWRIANVREAEKLPERSVSPQRPNATGHSCGAKGHAQASSTNCDRIGNPPAGGGVKLP